VPCCGAKDDPTTYEPEETRMTAKKKIEFVPLYTTAAGASMQIGNLGIATNTVGVPVPEHEVESLTEEKRLSTKPLHAKADKDEDEKSDEHKASKAGKKE
jgi:hypothetical protein